MSVFSDFQSWYTDSVLVSFLYNVYIHSSKYKYFCQLSLKPILNFNANSQLFAEKA